MTATLVFLAVLATAIAGCEDDEPDLFSLLGDGCLLNSDCDKGLVCVFERCHIECNDSSDCAIDDEGERLRCVVGEKPENVCQLSDEAKCAYHSECPGQQICGPDGSCRDQCQDDRDCVNGQVCVALGACADAEEIDDDGELTGSVPPPGQETGFPCSYSSQCLGIAAEQGFPNIEYVCRQGGCNIECFANADCEPGFECSTNDTPAAPGNCSLPLGDACIPGVQIACPCFGGGGTGWQVCNADGMSFGNCQNAGGDCSVP